jgi:hypothetical protein
MSLIHRLVLIGLMLSSSILISGQRAGILSTEFQLSGILDDERISWKTSKIKISIDKSDGKLIAFINVDDLSMKEKPAYFEEGAEKNQDNRIKLSCQLPLEQIIENNNERINTSLEVVIEYKGERTSTYLDFNIFSLRRQGFSIVCQGFIQHKDLDIESLQQLDDDLFVIWTIIGI